MIKDLLQEGYILKTKGFYKHAIESFYKALEHDNNSSELLLEIAESYYLMKDEERALNYIEQILEKDPTHVESLKLLKQIFVSKSAWSEAEQTAKNIYFISKNDEDLAKIFELLNQQGKYAEIFEYNVENFSENALYEKAYAKMFLGETDEALLYINKALENSSKDKFLLLKGKILYKMNRKEDCFEILDKIAFDENNAELMNFSGLVYQYKEDYKKAIEYFKIAIKTEPQKDEYYYNCASTYFKMGDTQQAKFFYNRAISLAPENQNYHFALANLYYAEKHHKRALEELNGDFWEAKLLKSIILYDSGYLALARKELEKLAEEQPENEMVKSYQDRIRTELGI